MGKAVMMLQHRAQQGAPTQDALGVHRALAVNAVPELGGGHAGDAFEHRRGVGPAVVPHGIEGFTSTQLVLPSEMGQGHADPGSLQKGVGADGRGDAAGQVLPGNPQGIGPLTHRDHPGGILPQHVHGSMQ